MFSESAALYDTIYVGGKLKDYRAEAAVLAGIIRQRRPTAVTLLDVACGTGEHARYLAEQHGFRVDGLDIEPAFVRLAAAKVPGGRFFQANMVDFALGQRYDVVCCLFSAIGYVLGEDPLARALARCRAHANPGGLVIVEPWFEPEQWQKGRVTHVCVEAEHGLVCRVARAGQEENVSVLDFHYLIATPQGIEHRAEVHRLQLRTRAELQAGFAAAGLRAEYEAPGISGRGLYIASAPE